MLAINLDLRNKTVLLIGCGAVGRRKLGCLLQSGASVRVLETRPDEFLEGLAEAGHIALHREWDARLLDGVALIFVATSDTEFNRRATQAARERGVWVNVAENPAEGDFFLPAVIERGDFRLTVSTGGHSPALAAAAAEKLRHSFGPEYGRLLALLAALRPALLASVESRERRIVFKKLAASEQLLKGVAAGDGPAIHSILKTLLPPDCVREARLWEIVNNTAPGPNTKE